MAAEPTQHPVERRLRALARTRREAARALPAWSQASRQRLRDEVARLHQRGNVLPDAAARSAGPWHAWKSIWAWGGVGIAGAALVWVVMFSSSPRPGPLAKGPADLASGGGLLQTGSPLPSPADAPLNQAFPAEPPTPGGLAGASSEADPAASAPAERASSVPTSATVAAPAAARDARFNFNAAQRIRHAFRAVPGAAPAPILQTFEILHTGGGIEIVDQDGSVYTGRLPRRAPSDAPKPTWTFEAQGVSRTLGKVVRLTGNFGEPSPEADATRSAAEPTAPAAAGMGGSAAPYLREAVSATVLVDGGTVFEVHAAPVPEAEPAP